MRSAGHLAMTGALAAPTGRGIGYRLCERRPRGQRSRDARAATRAVTEIDPRATLETTVRTVVVALARNRAASLPGAGDCPLTDQRAGGGAAHGGGRHWRAARGIRQRSKIRRRRVYRRSYAGAGGHRAAARTDLA